MQFTDAERDEVRRRLEQGMTPDAIANSIGRMSDLEEDEIAAVRQLAYELQSETNS